ncbi:MAG: hypothetical protein PHH09_07075, partial [Methanoregulaceae archaeon]|nr:hypothetical protein [Methanoregulaceae archaeon]
MLKVIIGAVFCILLIFMSAIVFFPGDNENRFNWKMNFTKDSNNTFTVTNVTYNSKTGESFGIGMYNAPLHNPEDSMHFSKCIENNEPFEGYYFISNQMYEQNDYLISCFLDYEQVPFSLDGSGPELLHRVYLAPFEEKFFRFDLGRLE